MNVKAYSRLWLLNCWIPPIFFASVEHKLYGHSNAIFDMASEEVAVSEL